MAGHYHSLVDNTLKTVRGEGIEARCICGWVSAGHFTSLAASAAFHQHVEDASKDVRTERVDP